MKRLQRLLDNNRAWASAMVARDPDFFARLVDQQRPRYLWIGCADSRVPANEIVDLAPGEIFVHRNVANLVIHTDLNCLSVLQFAVDVLEVEEIIVTGHYGCGGVAVALNDRSVGLVDNWLRHVKEIRDRHRAVLAEAGRAAGDRLCELNALHQAMHVCGTTVVQDAWRRGQKVAVHAWVYSLADGLVRDLGFCATSAEGSAELFDQAVRALPPRRPAP